MRLKHTILAGLIFLAGAGAASADDSAVRASAASVGASLLAGSAVGWTAYQGSEFTVKAVRASGAGVELVLEGASGALETSAKVSADAVRSASVGVGTGVRVVAESTGYALLASGVLLAFVPNEIGRALLHHARHQDELQ